MFSKRVNTQGGSVLQRIYRRWSLTVRLAVLYSLASFATLLLLGMMSFWLLKQSIEADELQALGRDVTEVKELLQAPEHNKALLASEIIGKSGTPGSKYRFIRYIRVSDHAGQVRFETTGMARHLPMRVFDDPRTAAKSGKRWRADDGRLYVLISITTDAAGAPWHIQAAMDLSKDEALVKGYQRKMSALLLLGIVLSTVIGVLVTYDGLRPLRDITAVAHRISAAQLHERVDPSRWPRELADLAGAFDQMLERLEASFAQLQQFSADLAHELRTPVNALMGEAEVALTRARSANEYREVLESALEEYNRLARLIDNLLFLARAEDPQAGIERAELDAQHEFEVICNYYDALIEEKGTRIQREGHGMVSADPILFRRALSNLLSNALRHTPPNGRIVLSVKHRLDGVEIAISDTGVGIDARQIPRIFERLYRVDGARRQHDGGAGLGLSIVKSIMTLHGGVVTLQSTPGKGTTVTLRFPPSPA